MNWLGLFKLDFLTSKDGKIAWYKIAHIVHTLIYVGIVAALVWQGGLKESLAWLFGWAVVLIFSIFGTKGMALYAAKAPDLKLEGKADLKDLVELIKKAKSSDDVS